MAVISPTFRSAFASGGSNQSVLKSCLDQLIGLLDFPAIGIVYFDRSLENDADQIVQSLRDSTGVDDWIGASGDQIIGGGKLLDFPSLAVLVLPLDQAHYRLFDGLADDVKGHANGLIHATIEQDSQNSLERMLLPSSTRFCGSQSSDGIHICNAIMAGGQSGISFDDAVRIETVINRAATPAGPVRTLTGSYADKITGIDGEDPIKALKADAGDILIRNPKQLNQHMLAALFSGEPTGQEASVGSEPHPGSRIDHAAITDFDPSSGTITLDRNLLGSHIRFLRRDPSGGMTKLEQSLSAAKAKLGRVTATIYIMSSRRGSRLFGAGTDELAAIRQIAGNAPVVGLVSEREVFNSRDEFCTSIAMLFGGVQRG